MSSCDLMFKLEQETDKLKMVIFQLYFRVIIRPSDLQKFTKFTFSLRKRGLPRNVGDEIKF